MGRGDKKWKVGKASKNRLMIDEDGEEEDC